mgnify:CR=1 FL=1
MSEEVLFDLPEQVTQAKILCIDDDPCVTDALARRFRPFDIEVLRAFHGMQGLWMAAQERPNAILTDLQMPRGRGDDLIRCLKANPLTANIPVFVITGIHDAGTASHLVALGANEVFFKPVEFNHVMEKVCESLGISLPS